MSVPVFYFDCFCGISGDMTVAALLDLGASREKLDAMLKSLHLHELDYAVGRKNSYGFDACDFDVILHHREDEHHHEHHEHGHCHDHHHEHRNIFDVEKIIDLKDKKQRDAVFAEWIDGLGEIENKYDYGADTLSALKWIEESNFSPDLTARLIEIRDAKRVNRSYYVRSAGVGNPEFTHENNYESMKYPDTGYRLLSLYRYWNMIQYFFPYKDIIGKDWQQVLTAYVPRFLNAKDEKEYLLASLELIAEVNDSHAYAWTRSDPTLTQYYGSREAVPRIQFVKDEAVVTSFFNDTLDRNHGMEIGDVITRIDNRSMKSIIQSRISVTAGSNRQAQLRDIARRLLYSDNESIRITYKRDGRSRKTTLKTFPQEETNRYFHLKPYTDTCFRLITPQIAYLFPGLLEKGDFQRLWNEVKNTKGLIIDMRFYGSEYLFDVANYLMPAPQEFVKFTKCNTIVPGAFIETSAVKIGMTKLWRIYDYGIQQMPRCKGNRI